MTKETHSSGGLIIALLALNVFLTKFISSYSLIYKIFLILLFFHSSYIGALFPDIDMKSSYISKRYPFLAKHFGKKCRHRGFTHSFLAVLLFSLFFEVIYMISNQNIIVLSIGLGFLLGYASHMILDFLTSEGIEFFNPIKINIHILPIKTGGTSEKYINKFLRLMIFFLCFYNILLIAGDYYKFDIITYILNIF